MLEQLGLRSPTSARRKRVRHCCKEIILLDIGSHDEVYR